MSMMDGSGEGPSSEINVTPMIDVLLVLLIIFMVVLPHHYWGEQADIPVPTEDVKTQPPEDPVVIQLHDRGRGSAPSLAVNQQEIAWDGLEPKLRDIYLKKMDKTAFLKGDPEIDFQYVADALDAAHHAGAERVALMGAKD